MELLPIPTVIFFPYILVIKEYVKAQWPLTKLTWMDNASHTHFHPENTLHLLYAACESVTSQLRLVP